MVLGGSVYCVLGSSSELTPKIELEDRSTGFSSGI
jgi:hypothetical protein